MHKTLISLMLMPKEEAKITSNLGLIWFYDAFASRLNVTGIDYSNMFSTGHCAVVFK